MRYLTFAAVTALAAGIGLLVGVLLGQPNGTTLAVVAQQREDQITMFSDGSPEAIGARVVGVGAYDLLQTNGMVQVGVNPSHYPSSAVFQLETVLTVGTPIGEPTAICLRLLDLTASTPVSDSEVCHTVSGGSDTVRVRSASYTLAARERDYTIQGKTSNKGARVGAARIIAEWTEPVAVGGIAEVPVVADAQRDTPTSVSPLPLGASVAVGLLLLGAGGLYVVKLRRG